MRAFLHFHFLLSFGHLIVYGQDIHWSQPSSTLLYLNPAFTGISAKNSASINYRNQWNSLNHSYETYMLNADTRLNKTAKGSSMNLGVLVVEDKAAAGNYRSTTAGFSISSLIKLNKVMDFGAGLGFNLQQNKIQSNNYAWGKQYDGQDYNPTLSTGETALGATKSFADVSTGISTRYNKKGRSRYSPYHIQFVVGYGAAHINRPRNSLYGSGERLNIKHSFYFMGQFQFQSDVALKPIFQYYQQGNLLLIASGGLFRYSFNEHTKKSAPKKEAAISMGFVYRNKDAIVPLVEFETARWIIGVSYDATTSQLNSYNQFRGGMEISIRFKGSDWFWGSSN